MNQTTDLIEDDEDTQYLSEDTSSMKLTNWTKEPSLTDLKSDFDGAKPYHDRQMTNIARWNNLMKVDGPFKPVKVRGRSSVQPKLVRKQAEWRYPALSEPFLGTDKLFKITPVTASDVNSAKQNELVINWQFRTKMNRIKFIDDYVRSAVDDGTVFVRLGWTRVTVKATKEVPVFNHYPSSDPDYLNAFKNALAQSVSDPVTYEKTADPAMQAAITLYDQSGEITQAVQAGTQIVEYDHVIENKPTVEVMEPENVYIDPSCNGDLDKALFCIFTFETNRASLQKEGRYVNLDKVNWDNCTIQTESNNYTTKTPDDFAFKDPARKKVVAYEYWGFYDVNGDGTLVPIVSTWVGNTIIRMEENPFPDQKLPLVIATYLPKKRDMYGEADADLLEDNQKIMGALTRGMIDLLGRSANSQIGFAKGMLDPLNRKRFEEGKDYDFNPNLPPTAAMIQHKYPELPQSALQLLAIQNQDAEALTGVKAFSGGISGDAYGDVATGIKGALDASAKREMSILRRLAQGISQIGTKIIAMNGEFMSEEEVIPITDEQFVTVTRDELQGNHNTVVDISTAEVDNAQAQDLGFMLQTIGPAVQDIKITLMILAKICDLKRLPDLALALRNYQPPPPDPMQQQMAQAELMLKQTQALLFQAQAALAQSQSGKAASEKDLKDLQYVEQESGTDHARKMQLATAQSEGNQQLEITKALTKPIKEGEKAPNIAAAVGYSQLAKAMNTTGQPE